MSERKQTIDYAAANRADTDRARRVRFALWLAASVVFLAASCGSLLAYVWWLKIS